MADKQKTSVKNDTVLTKMNDKWMLGEGYRKDREQDYIDNYGLYTSDRTSTWKDVILPPGAPDFVINKLMAVERALRSKLYPIIGDFQADPVEETDRAYANAVNKWLEWFQEQKQWSTMKNRLLKGNFIYNDCAVEVVFDPTENYPEGSLKVEVRYPWEYTCDPIGKEWVQIRVYVPRGVLKTLYPNKKKEIDDAPNAPAPERGGLGLKYVSNIEQRNTASEEAGNLEDYVVVHKHFEKSYEWNTITEEETIEAVKAEWQAIIEFFYPTQEQPEDEEEMEEEPTIAFDETDNHPEHSRFLVKQHNEWLQSSESQSVNPQVLPDIQKAVEEHTKRHSDTAAYMETAKVPYGTQLKYPGGEMSISIENKVMLYTGDNPIGRFPLVRFPFLEDERTKFAKPFATYLAPVYRLRLLVINKFYFLMNLMTPKFVHSGELETGQLDNDPSKPLKLEDATNAGWAVPSLNMGTLGTSDFVELLDNDMEEMTNIYAAGKGKVPSGVKSGKALQALEEFGSTVSNLDAMVYEEPLQELGMLIWIAAAKYLGTEHFKRVIGRKAGVETLENLELNKISEVALDISAKMRDPALTTKEATLKYLMRVFELPGVSEYFSPAIKAKMVTDQLELPKLDEYLQMNEEYLQMITEMTAQMVAQAMAEQQMEQQAMGGEEAPPEPMNGEQPGQGQMDPAGQDIGGQLE